MKFYAINFFCAQQQRKDGKEAKFMNFGREKHKVPALRATPNKNSDQRAKMKQKTEFCALWTNIKYPESLKF